VPGDRTGRFLHVAHGDGGTILRFDVAGGAGKLTSAREAAKTGSPVCIVFQDAD
jgi:6-phosphogluconolactonase (cycloisomerase 2 family)